MIGRPPLAVGFTLTGEGEIEESLSGLDPNVTPSFMADPDSLCAEPHAPISLHNSNPTTQISLFSDALRINRERRREKVEVEVEVGERKEERMRFFGVMLRESECQNSPREKSLVKFL